jgi:hypothetical protein
MTSDANFSHTETPIWADFGMNAQLSSPAKIKKEV